MSERSTLNVISPKAKIGNDVTIGSFVTIYDNVVIGDNVCIDSYCELGVSKINPDSEPLIIGPNSRIRSHSIFYAGSSFGSGLTTGHSVIVRENIQAGVNLRIGTLADLQGHTNIGDYVTIHSNAHIGQHSRIGNYVWIYPYVVLTNDPTPPSNFLKGPTIEDWVVVATSSVILPGILIGSGALVGAMSLVSKNVESNTVVVGAPARERGFTKEILLKDGSGRRAYPWFRHFQKGYPVDLVNKWIQDLEES